MEIKQSSVYRFVPPLNISCKTRNKGGLVVETMIPYKSVMTRYQDLYSPRQKSFLRRGDMTTRNDFRVNSRSLFDLSKLASINSSRYETRADSINSRLRLSDLNCGDTMNRLDRLRSEAQLESPNST